MQDNEDFVKSQPDFRDAILSFYLVEVKSGLENNNLIQMGMDDGWRINHIILNEFMVI